MSKTTAYIFLILAVGIFLAAMLALLPCPGLPGEMVPLIKALQLVNNVEDAGVYVDIFGRHLPLNTEMRHGAFEVYLIAPFVALGNLKIEVLRAVPVMFAVITIFFTFILAKAFFNQTVAVISVLLMAINQYFIYHMRLGLVWGFTVQIFSILPVLLLYKFYITKRNFYFYWAMLILGVGLNARGHHIWFIVGFALSAWVCSYSFLHIKKKLLLSGLGFFLIGAMPVSFYYLGFHRFHEFVVSSFPVTSGHFLPGDKGSINNALFFNNFFTRLTHVAKMIFRPSLFVSSHGRYFCYLWGLCSVFTLNKIFFSKSSSFSKRKTLFIFLTFLFALVASCFTFTVLNLGHLLMLTPYIVIITAVVIYETLKTKTLVLMRLLGAILVLAIICFNYTGIKSCSQENYVLPALTQWLAKNNVKAVITTNPMLNKGIEFYSGLKIDPFEFAYLGMERRGLRRKLKRIIKAPGPPKAFVDRRDRGYSDLGIFVKELGKKMVKTLTIGDYDVYLIQ